MNNKDAYWITHDVNAKDDPKCAMMIEQFGPEAYGIFWILIEILREQPDFCYPLALVPSIARKYNTTKDKVMAVISGYGLFEICEDQFFYSKSLINRVIEWKEKKDHKRAVAIKAAMISWEKRRERQALEIADSNANAMQTHSDCNATALPIKNIKEIKDIESKDSCPQEENIFSEEDVKVAPKYMTPEEMVTIWNSDCGELPKARPLSDKRKQKAKLRIAEFGKTRGEQIGLMKEITARLAKSDFANGKTGGTWKADFGWLIENSENWVKVMEGRYDNRKPRDIRDIKDVNSLWKE